MNLFLVLPILIPFLTAIVSLLFWTRRRLQRVLSTIGALGLFGSALGLLWTVWQTGVQAAQIGNWPAPFGITIVSDLFSAIMVVMTGIVGVVISLYSLSMMDPRRESFGYYPLLHVLLMGVCGSFLTGDIFNLYVWFEVMLIASFVLVVLGGEKAQLEGAVKYVTLNLVSSALFLTAVGILYGVVGTLNMADLALQLKMISSRSLVNTLAMLFFIAFGIKAAIFPLFFWLPASYHTPPVPVSALFSGLLTKVGVYALIRTFTLIFPQDQTAMTSFILLVAGLTMVTGVLGAVAQNEFRRLLSFHIVSQIGYMIMGLGFFSPLGITGAILHMVHNMLAKTNLFLLSGVVYRIRGTYKLPELGGIYRSYPFISILFIISAFSLAGMPPLSGFWSKLLLIKAGLELKSYALVLVALLVSLLTLFSMTKIWDQVFWKVSPVAEDSEQMDGRLCHGVVDGFFLFMPLLIPVVLILSIGFFTEIYLEVMGRAAQQLLNPAEYIQSVLGGRP